MNNLQNKFYLKNKSRGQAMLAVVVVTFLIGLGTTLGFVAPTTKEAEVARELYHGKQSYIVAESGQEDVGYRVRTGKSYSGTEVLTIGEFSATTTVSDNISTGVRSVTTDGSGKNTYRSRSMTLVRGDTISFNYGAQAGNGGLIMRNSSSVLGNVYSNGTIIGTQDNMIKGTVVSAGPSGLVDGIYATGTTRSHTINDSIIDRDAYYQVITNSVVRGTAYPNSADEPVRDLPISDETLDEWEAAAAAGGVITTPCPYIISENATLGPVKINCDLEIRNNPTVTLSGMVWVSGNITVTNSPTINLSSDLAAKSVALIADKQSDRTNSSQVVVRNRTTFGGSGQPNSYVTLVSRNTSAENGGSVIGIDLQQTVEGDILAYAKHGKVKIANSSSLKSLSAYLIEMINSAELVYEDGLESTLFDTGPGGSWEISGWNETE